MKEIVLEPFLVCHKVPGILVSSDVQGLGEELSYAPEPGQPLPVDRWEANDKLIYPAEERIAWRSISGKSVTLHRGRSLRNEIRTNAFRRMAQGSH